MKISDAGIALIKSFEGLRLDAYPDPATGGDPWTIGYGSTKGVKPGMTVTEEEADALLRADVAEAERCVNATVHTPLAEGEFDALCSLVFNIGCGKFRGSTLLKLILAGDMDGAALEFKKWNKAGGQVMAGLARRRKAEADMFEGVA